MPLAHLENARRVRLGPDISTWVCFQFYKCHNSNSIFIRFSKRYKNEDRSSQAADVMVIHSRSFPMGHLAAIGRRICYCICLSEIRFICMGWLASNVDVWSAAVADSSPAIVVYVFYDRSHQQRCNNHHLGTHYGAIGHLP